MKAIKYKKLSSPRNRNQLVTAAVVIVSVAAIGIRLLVASHAATPYTSIAAHQGTPANGATAQTCSGATDGSCIQFGPTPGGGTNPQPSGVPGSWTLKFDDEFNSTGLDTTKWSTGWFGSGITQPVNSGEEACYDPAQVSVSGGYLNLGLIAKAESCGGTTRPYAGSLIDTNGKYSFTYGFIEARIWLPGTSAVYNWPDFWTDGQNWPADGEMDVAEGLGGSVCYHFHDSSGGPGDCAAGNFAGGWHTFAADWENGVVTYYYDGQQVGQIASGITAAPMYIVLNNTTDNTYGGQSVPGTMLVDYVRIWQH